MSGLDKNRVRNQTICFRATPEERRQIEARVFVSGMQKGQYYIQSLLHQELKIIVGKYQSDRLSIEIRHLRVQLEQISETDKTMLYEPLRDCKALLKQLVEIMQENKEKDKTSAKNFAMEK